MGDSKIPGRGKQYKQNWTFQNNEKSLLTSWWRIQVITYEVENPDRNDKRRDL